MEDVVSTLGSKEGSDGKDEVERLSTPTLARPATRVTQLLSRKLKSLGVEARGIRPVDVEDRTETNFIKIFFLWFSANTNILSFSTGTLGPAAFGLGLRDSCLIITFFTLLSAIPPSYFTTWGPKLGLRQMCAARYAFGYYGIIFPSIFAIAGGVGFCVLGCILGGQALATIANISWTIGIVIIALICLLVSFCGIRVLSWFENCAWLPALIIFIVATGVGGKHFVNDQTEPASAEQIFNFAATVAGFTVSWSAISSDYTVYFRPDVPSWRIFTYSFLGLIIPTITLQCLGAAAAISASSVPDWDAGFANGNVAGLLNAMLNPVGGFGKVLMVLLSLSVAGNIIPTIYSMCMASQTLIPSLVAIPRYVFPVLLTAVILALAIAGQHRFYVALSNFLGIIGYWTAMFVAVVCVEHLYFRKGDFARYDLRYWNAPSQLPLGAAAVGASVLSLFFVIPSMNQVWYTGPIARKAGDLGLETALIITALLYIPLRHLETRWRGV